MPLPLREIGYLTAHGVVVHLLRRSLMVLAGLHSLVGPSSFPRLELLLLRRLLLQRLRALPRRLRHRERVLGLRGLPRVRWLWLRVWSRLLRWVGLG